MGQMGLPEPPSSKSVFESHTTNFPSKAEPELLVSPGGDPGWALGSQNSPWMTQGLLGSAS